MDRDKELQERLKQIAADIQFSHYIVCRFCRRPIILLGDEARRAPGRLRCENCQGVMEYDAAGIRSYPP